MSLGRLLLFGLTAAVFLLALLAFVSEPPPLWVPWSLGAVYLGVVVWGTLNLQLEMFGDAICAVQGSGPQVALTFDDGPDPVTTPLVLALLKKADVRATFFVVGKKVVQHPGVVKQIVEAGHSVGVHSYDHNRLYSFLPPDAVHRDIEMTRDVIEESTGQRPVWFRPPVGQMSPRTAGGVKRAGSVVIGWSVRARDGARGADPEKCLQRIRKGLSPGAIVLLHDAWEKSPSLQEDNEKNALLTAPAGVQILQRVLDACREKSLQPVTIEELLISHPSEPA